jgi:hypothetical protein
MVLILAEKHVFGCVRTLLRRAFILLPSLFKNDRDTALQGSEILYHYFRFATTPKGLQRKESIDNGFVFSSQTFRVTGRLDLLTMAEIILPFENRGVPFINKKTGCFCFKKEVL